MLTINPISQNNVAKNQTNFTSKLVKTSYLAEGFENALGNLKHSHKAEGSRDFYKSVKALVNDGQSREIKIDAKPNTYVTPGNPKPQDIFVDGALVVDGDKLGGEIYDGAQCQEGIINFAR